MLFVRWTAWPLEVRKKDIFLTFHPCCFFSLLPDSSFFPSSLVLRFSISSSFVSSIGASLSCSCTLLYYRAVTNMLFTQFSFPSILLYTSLLPRYYILLLYSWFKTCFTTLLEVYYGMCKLYFFFFFCFLEIGEQV